MTDVPTAPGKKKGAALYVQVLVAITLGIGLGVVRRSTVGCG